MRMHLTALLGAALSAATLNAQAAQAAQAEQAPRAPQAPQAPQARRANEHGRIPILEYHLIGTRDSRWGRSAESFRRDLELLYARGYRPITVAQLVDGDIDIPAGTSPVVITFDDASPGQFRYVVRGGTKEIDPSSGVGIWLAFGRTHPDWRNRATFCLLSGAEAGHNFFGDRGIDGQQTSWRFEKLRFLADQGFELCGHTVWHANLSKFSDATVQEQIARNVMAIDSALTGYRVRTFALPLGEWPRHRALASTGSWRNPATGRDVRYAFDAVLEVTGAPVASPATDRFNPHALQRIQVIGAALEALLDHLDQTGERFVSAGSGRINRPKVAPTPRR